MYTQLGMVLVMFLIQESTEGPLDLKSLVSIIVTVPDHET